MTTLLLEAIRCKQYEIVKYLLENGANPYQKEWLGSEDAFKIAQSLKDKKMAELLKEFS